MCTRAESISPALATIGIDIGKEVFHIVGFGADGKIAFRRKIKRLALTDTFRKLPPCVVGMEACLSAHFVSRALRQLGHEPRIIPAIYVKPFVKGQKNDYNDAEAIAEAAPRPHAGLRLVHLETAKILRRRRVGRAADEGRKRLHATDVVTARVLGEAAHGHVFDHALAQRAAGRTRRIGDHRMLLSS